MEAIELMKLMSIQLRFALLANVIDGLVSKDRYTHTFMTGYMKRVTGVEEAVSVSLTIRRDMFGLPM